MKFRRRAVVTDAEKWDGTPESADRIRAMGATFEVTSFEVPLMDSDPLIVVTGKLTTKLGVVGVPIGHWVVRTGAIPSQREFWSRAPEVFEAEYEVDV